MEIRTKFNIGDEVYISYDDIQRGKVVYISTHTRDKRRTLIFYDIALGPTRNAFVRQANDVIATAKEAEVFGSLKELLFYYKKETEMTDTEKLAKLREYLDEEQRAFSRDCTDSEDKGYIAGVRDTIFEMKKRLAQLDIDEEFNKQLK